MCPLIRNGNRRARVEFRLPHLLLADPPGILRNPKLRRSRRDTGFEVRIAHFFLAVLDLHQVAADLLAKGGIVAVEIRVEPSPDGLPFGSSVVGSEKGDAIRVFFLRLKDFLFRI